MAEAGHVEADKSSKISVENDGEGNDEARKIDESDDKELYDLLDSALEDFKNPAQPQDSVQNQPEKEPKVESTPAEKEWSDDFIEQATAQFQDAMKAFLGNDSSLSEEFRKMAEATGKAMASQEPDADLTESLAQTLKGLAENAEAVSNPLSDEEISQLLSNIGLSSEGNANENESDLLNIMENMMQNLLSKDLLFPALKEIVEKYPDWLAENRAKVSETDYQKYDQQYRIMKQACEEFEAEKDDDGADVKKARFERILGLMQKMQEYGHPPKELIGEMDPRFEFDEHGNPKIPGLPSLPGGQADSCSLM